MLVVYVPRSLSTEQVKAIRDKAGKACRVKKGWCSQIAWATGAQTTENHCLLVNINSMIANWRIQEL